MLKFFSLKICRRVGMADEADSKSVARKSVRVQVPPPALTLGSFFLGGFMIVFDNVSFTYGKRKVLNNLNFSLCEGEFLSVLGKNGSGKSTMAKLFNGILLPTEGEVIVDGLKTSDEKSLREIRTKVGVVFQNPDNQMVTTPLEDEIAFGPENLCLSSEEIEERVESALRAVGLSDCRKKAPEELSGGQKQLAAIAGVLAMKPKVLVLDEPTSMLDPLNRRNFMAILNNLRKEFSLSIVLITHHMEEAIFSDRIFILSEGEKVKSGSPREIFSETDILNSNALTVPEITRLGKILFERGIISREIVLNEEELLEALND